MKRLFFISGILAIIIAAGLIFYQFVYLKNQQGALQITANAESKVYLNNNFVGTTPICFCGERDDPDRFKELLRVGDYELRLEPKDSRYPTYHQNITIQKTTLTVVDRMFEQGASSESFVIALEQLTDKENNELVVQTVPSGAEVLLDDVPIGYSTVTKENLPDSDHTVTLIKDGYKAKSIRIKITNGYRLNLSADLGIDPNFINLKTEPASKSAELSPAPEISVSKVTILQTGTGFLRVRSENNLNSEEIGRVTPGQEFEVIEEEESWVKIKFDDKEGWVSKEFTQKVTP